MHKQLCACGCGEWVTQKVESQHINALAPALLTSQVLDQNQRSIWWKKRFQAIEFPAPVHWWACLASTLRNHINCTCLFKFQAYSRSSYHYHSIPTTPLTLWLPIQDKVLPKHIQSALCNYDKNSLKESLCSQIGALLTWLQLPGSLRL